MSDPNVTSAEVSAHRVVQALMSNIASREEKRAALRREKIAGYQRPRKFLGFEVARTAEEAIKAADENLSRFHGENATYYWHGVHIREMRKILELAQAVARTPGATIRMSVEDFQYVSKYYNDQNN